LDKEQISNYF